jgi:hypothetical protein
MRFSFRGFRPVDSPCLGFLKIPNLGRALGFSRVLCGRGEFSARGGHAGYPYRIARDVSMIPAPCRMTQTRDAETWGGNSERSLPRRLPRFCPHRCAPFDGCRLSTPRDDSRPARGRRIAEMRKIDMEHRAATMCVGETRSAGRSLPCRCRTPAPVFRSRLPL